MKKIKISWEDAITYRNGVDIPKATSIFTTVGLFECEKNGFIIIKDPVTTHIVTNQNHPINKSPRYYCIPLVSIVNVEINRD